MGKYAYVQCLYQMAEQSATQRDWQSDSAWESWRLHTLDVRMVNPSHVRLPGGSWAAPGSEPILLEAPPHCA